MIQCRFNALPAALVVLMTSLSVPCALGAQEPVGLQPVGDKPAGAIPAEVPRPNYRIGAGDVLEIKVLGEDQMSSPATRVSADGFVSVPWVGDPVQAQCLSERELADAIATRLKKYLKYPEVYVSVKEYNSIPVAVIGAVNQPGRFRMERRVGLLELITYAGGLSKDAGTVLHVVHSPSVAVCDPGSDQADGSAGFVDGSEAETISLARLLEGDRQADRVMLPGDIVVVPNADLIFVAGEVLKPNAYPLREGMTFSQALALAGGPTRLAKTGSMHIVRNEPGKARVEIPVDPKAIANNTAEDPRLLPNDLIEVPNSAGKTFFTNFFSALGGSVASMPVRAVP